MSNATLQLGGGNFAVKDGKLLGYATDPRTSVFVSREFDFSRGSNLAATRVDANGLIEKGRENLLLQSNQFDTTWTTTSSITLTSGQSGYDGTSNAWLLARTSTGGQRVAQAISQSGVQTFSVYAKANVGHWLYMRCNTSGSPVEGYFDLSNGVLGDYGLGTRIDAQIENVGNGWYRCSMAFSETITETRLYPVDENGSVIGTNESIYIQDAQLEVGLVATDYIETGATTAQAGILEDMPRIDYTNSSSPALLLEPQRTNLLPHSEWIGGWANVNDATMDAPQEFTLGSAGARIQSGSIGSPSGDFVFYAMFDSADIGKTIRLSYYDATAGGWNFGSDITIDSNGRAERIISTGSNIVGNVAFCGTSTSQSFTLKYCQFEAGSYPTSYIPTYGTAVTRSEDTFRITGISDLIDTQGGVMLLETQALDRDQGYSGVSLSDDTFTNNAQIRYGSTTNQIQVQYRVGNSNECLASSTGNDITNNLKIAFKYEADSFKMFVNGALETTDTSGSVNAANTFDTIKSDRGNGSDKYLGRIRQLAVFPTALTDAECIALTTL